MTASHGGGIFSSAETPTALRRGEKYQTLPSFLPSLRATMGIERKFHPVNTPYLALALPREIRPLLAAPLLHLSLSSSRRTAKFPASLSLSRRKSGNPRLLLRLLFPPPTETSLRRYLLCHPRPSSLVSTLRRPRQAEIRCRPLSPRIPSRRPCRKRRTCPPGTARCRRCPLFCRWNRRSLTEMSPRRLPCPRLSIVVDRDHVPSRGAKPEQ